MQGWDGGEAGAGVRGGGVVISELRTPAGQATHGTGHEPTPAFTSCAMGGLGVARGKQHSRAADD